ncbi:unannotated protein [freshwater metagenome]|uniref:Unannotated protein n=1 Tax=freshwater metagenome TaxID=449393 RepID=A0A6J7LGJ4_9ZZZZ
MAVTGDASVFSVTGSLEPKAPIVTSAAMSAS